MLPCEPLTMPPESAGADQVVRAGDGARREADDIAGAALIGIARDDCPGERRLLVAVVEPAAVSRGVSADRAVGEHHRAAVGDPAASNSRGISADRAVGKRRRPGMEIVHTGAVFRGVPADRATGECPRATVDYSTTF